MPVIRPIPAINPPKPPAPPAADEPVAAAPPPEPEVAPASDPEPADIETAFAGPPAAPAAPAASQQHVAVRMRPHPHRPRVHSINEFSNFELAVVGDVDLIKQLTDEQFEALRADVRVLQQLMIPGFELAKLQLAQYIKENISPRDPKVQAERSRLGLIAQMTVEVPK